MLVPKKALFILPLFLVVIISLVGTAWAAIPERMSYEGRLLDSSGNVITTPVSMGFRIYDALTSGSVIWTSGSYTVSPESSGVFSVILGSNGDPIPASGFDSDTRYLEVIIGSEVLSPRIQLVSSPYAYRTAVADSLDGLTSSDLVLITGSTITGSLTVEGTLYGTTFSGDGSQLTGVVATDLADGSVTTPKISEEAVTEPKLDSLNVPSGGQVLSWNAGSSRFEWITPSGAGDITAVNAGAALTGGGTSGAVTLDVAYDDLTVGLESNGSLEVKDSAISGGKLTPDINITTTGIITAAAFSGDGSGLGGITVSTADYATLAGTASSAAYADLSGIASTSAYADLSGTASTAATVSDFAITPARIATSAVTAEKLASNAAVLSLASAEAARLTGNVDLKAGSNIALTQTGQTIEVTAVGAGGGTVTLVDSGAALAGGPITGAGTLEVKYDNATIGLQGSGSLEVKNSGISGAKLTPDINISTTGIITAAAFSGTIESSGSISGNKFKITPEGGYAVKLTNGTGSSSIKGSVVRASQALDNAFVLTTTTTSIDAIGVVYESGIANGSECWVVMAGIADVLMEDSVASTHGYFVSTYNCSTGRARADSPEPPNTQAHWQELGHCLESKSAGTNVLAKVILHFN